MTPNMMGYSASGRTYGDKPFLAGFLSLSAVK